MIHTVHLDDSFLNIRALIHELRLLNQGVRFENPETSDIAPEGFLTSDEFWKEADKRIIKVCKQHGILQ